MSIGKRALTHVRSNVVAYTALFFVIGGSSVAMAANTVFSTDIVNGEVKAVDIGGGEVATGDIANDGVATADVMDDTLSGGGLTKDDLRSGSVRGSEVANESLNGQDVAAAAARDSATFVTVPGDGSDTELTNATITPEADGSILATAKGYCNMEPNTVAAGTDYQVQVGIGVDATDATGTDFANHGFIGIEGSADTFLQQNYIAERVFAATAGVPLTLRVFGYDAFAAGGTQDCSSALTLVEMPNAVVEPAIAGAKGTTDPTGAGAE